MALTPGTRLGPYEIVSSLGSGGMGEVYRARDPRLGRDVAIKVVLGSAGDDPATHERFEREARAVAALAHPNIVALFDVGVEAGMTFVVTELLEGETLRQRLAAGGPMPVRRALEYCAQVARGLAAAHERGIVHRDLKPENLFLTTDGRLKILDFGLAQREPPAGDPSAADTVAVTQAGTFVGTPGYASPEQAQGEPATPRSDVFSLGIVLYELLTGRHPFARANTFETLTAILREDAPPLGPVPGLPIGMDRLVERCLEKRPAERPGSAGDLAFLLETLAAHGAALPASSEPGPGSRSHPVDLGPLRRRVVLLVCGLMLLFLAATWGYVQAMARRTVAEAIEADLARAAGTVARVHQERLAALRLTARLVASFPELKALFETDTATIRDYLLGYQQRNPGTGVLLAFGPAGDVLARTDEASSSVEETWLPAVLQSPSAASVVTLGSRPFQVAAAESEARGVVFGYVVAALPVDAEFARALGEATRDDVVLLGKDRPLGSTLASGRAPWTSLAAWREQAGRATTVHAQVAGQTVTAREVPLQRDPPVSAIVVTSDDEAVEPYRRIQRGVALMGLAAIALAITGSLWLTRHLAIRAN